MKINLQSLLVFALNEEMETYSLLKKVVIKWLIKRNHELWLSKKFFGQTFKFLVAISLNLQLRLLPMWTKVLKNFEENII